MAPSESDAATLDNVTDIAQARKSRQATQQSPPGDVASNTSEAPNRHIDYEKVARLKAEIEAGTYKINAARIADKFIEREGK